jgi:hypothetical protein
LAPRDFRIASRLRLGLAAHDGPLGRCICGHDNALVDKYHGLACIKCRRSYTNLRHDFLKEVPHTWSRRLGASSLKEPQNLVAGQERADNFICTPDGDLLLCDVAVVQPSCPTHVRKGQKRLAVADQMALQKHAQYNVMAAAEHATFYAMVVEVYGSPNDETIKLVKRIARIAKYDDSYGYTYQEVVTGMMSAIGVAVQRGNALILHRMRILNIVAGLVQSQAQRDAQARRDARSQKAAEFVSSSQPHAGSSPADVLSANDDAFGADGPVFFPHQDQSVHSLVEVNINDGFGEYPDVSPAYFGGEEGDDESSSDEEPDHFGYDA